MNLRIAAGAVGLFVVGLVVALLWNADESADVETQSNASSVRAEDVDGSQPVGADAAHRVTIDATVPPATEAPTPAPLAVIGRVEDSAGHAIADARVAIVTTDEDEKTIVAEARTGTDGAFEVPVSAPTPATVEFTAKDHVGVVRTGVMPNEPILVRLAAGVTLAGRVVDAQTHAPIAHADVSLESAGTFRHTSQFTDEHGTFEIVVPRVPAALRGSAKHYGESRAFVAAASDSVEIGLSAGTAGSPAWYRVVDRDSREPVETAVIRPGPCDRVGPGLYHAGTWFGIEQERSAWIEAPGYLNHLFTTRIVGGEDSSHPLDVAMRPASSLRGTLVDAERRAIAGARIVVARAPSKKNWLDRDEWFIQSATETDARGAFAVTNVPIQVPLTLTAERAGALIAERTPIVVDTRDPLLLGEVRAEVGMAVEVFVCRQSDRSAVANALVRAFDGPRVRVAHTDAGGRATLDPIGRISFVVASAPGLAPAWRAIDPTSPSQRIECALTAPGRLAGIVTDLAGEPLEGSSVRVEFVAEDPVLAQLRAELTYAALDPLEFTQLTDATGRFAFVDLAPGTYRVKASHPDASPNAMGVERADDLVVKTDRDDLTLKLPLLGTLVMHVTSARSGLAIDHVTFQANTPTSGSGMSTHRTNGYATLAIAAGVKFSIVVSSGGYAPRVFSDIELAPREVRLLEVALDAESSFAGVARFADGNPAAGAQLQLAPKAPGLDPVKVTCDAAGAFRATRLAAGEFGLSVHLPLAGDEDSLVSARVEPAVVAIGSGEQHAQDLVVLTGESGAFEFTFAAEGVPDGAELIGFDIGIYAGDEELLYRNQLPARESLHVPGLPLGACEVRGRMRLRAKSDGVESSLSATFEPATIEVTKSMGDVAIVVRPKAH